MNLKEYLREVVHSGRRGTLETKLRDEIITKKDSKEISGSPDKTATKIKKVIDRAESLEKKQKAEKYKRAVELSNDVSLSSEFDKKVRTIAANKQIWMGAEKEAAKIGLGKQTGGRSKNPIDALVMSTEQFEKFKVVFSKLIFKNRNELSSIFNKYNIKINENFILENSNTPLLPAPNKEVTETKIRQMNKTDFVNFLEKIMNDKEIPNEEKNKFKSLNIEAKENKDITKMQYEIVQQKATVLDPHKKGQKLFSSVKISSNHDLEERLKAIKKELGRPQRKDALYRISSGYSGKTINFKFLNTINIESIKLDKNNVFYNDQKIGFIDGNTFVINIDNAIGARLITMVNYYGGGKDEEGNTIETEEVAKGSLDVKY